MEVGTSEKCDEGVVGDEFHESSGKFSFFFSPSRVIALSIGRRRGDDELNGATQEASSEVASRRDGQATRGGM